MKLLKMTISGSYLTASKDIVDFEDISGVIPLIDEDKAAQYVLKRYAIMWVKGAKDKDGEKLFDKRIEKMRQVFIDDMEEIEGQPLSFVGKDIKKMSYEELQDLAAAKDFNRIPLPKQISGVSLRDMRTMAYVEYSEKVFNKDIKHNSSDFNFAKLAPLVVDDHIRRDDAKKVTNEEIIEREQESYSTDNTGSSLSLDDLKGIAKEKDIPFHPNIGFDKLHAKLYGGVV